jgi:hypothetical protein
MDMPDTEKERWRLSRVYGSMTEGEVEELAANAGSLSDAAKWALKMDLSRRGLKVELREPVVAPESKKYSRLVTIRTFRDVPEAYLAKSILDSAEIESFLFDANIVWTDWFWSNAVGGVKLRVREEDADEAVALLDQGGPIELDARSADE